MEAPNYALTTVGELEKIIERFVPKLFYDYKYNFQDGLVIFVPKKYISIVDECLKDSYVIVSRYKVLDIAKR